MTGAPNKPTRIRRDVKPSNLTVKVALHEDVDPKRLRRIAEILASILDNETDSGPSSAP